MSGDIALSPETSRLIQAGLNEVLFAGTPSSMRDSAVLAAHTTILSTVQALGKSANDVLTVFGLIRAKKPRNHAELALVCQIIIAEDRALKNATLARLMEKRGELARAMEYDDKSRQSNALALRYGARLLRYQRKQQRYHGPEVRNAVLRDSRWR